MEYFDIVEKLERDLKKNSVTLNKAEVRYIVDLYYTVQGSRIRSKQKLDKLIEFKKPHELIDLFWKNFSLTEKQIKASLKVYSESTHMGRWAQQYVGVGPVLSSALESYLDITRARTAGSIWRFCGLDPTSKWNKGEKRPWCATMKTTAWKLGQSFMKFSKKDNDIYGHFYRYRRLIELEKNEKYEFKEQANDIIKRAKENPRLKLSASYKEALNGKLCVGHISQRARRWATKIFLAHWFNEAYIQFYKKDPPRCYAVEHLGHVHEMRNPEEAKQWLERYGNLVIEEKSYIEEKYKKQYEDEMKKIKNRKGGEEEEKVIEIIE